MLVMFIDQQEQKVLLSVEISGESAPIPGDVIAMPNSTELYSVIQRAFVLDEATDTKVVDFSKPKQLTITLQITVVPVTNMMSEGMKS